MKQSQHYINHRLLKYKINDIDYNIIIKNKAKFNLIKKILILNYFYFIKKDDRKIVLASRKLCGPKWFKSLEKLKILNHLVLTYNIQPTKESIWLWANNKQCEICGTPILSKRRFCSNKCSNIFKHNDLEYKKNHKSGLKKYHSKCTIKEKEIKYAKISESIKIFNNNLTSEERSAKYTNKILNYTSFSNLKERYQNLDILFNEEYYYANKYLPVKCKDCGTEWEMTKTTSICRTICRTCNPYKKHKTQTEIFNFISEFYSAKEDDKSLISNEIDILVSELKFGIEYDGLLSHSYGYSKISYYNNFYIDKNYHLQKTKECESKGYQLFHIFENEYLDQNKKNIWLSIIKNKLNSSDKIYARKCSIKEISNSEYKQFTEHNHLQGYGIASIRLGLFYNDELVSIMSFGKSRYNKSIEYELIRFCSKLNTQIIGGASKLLKHFERTYNPESIISYANRRWSQGHLYEILGFEFSHNTDPNYFYFRINENILYSREKFQKHKLKNKLELFDSELSETENMFNNGYRKIYDCGNKVYVKKY